MGKCIFCRQDANWFAHEHADCRRRHDAEEARLARAQAEEQARRARELEQEQARLGREQAEEQARLQSERRAAETEQAKEQARLESERQAAEARRLAALPRSFAPRSFADIVGQTHAVERLTALREHALARREPVPHTLLIGPGGTGKRTLAGVLANEMGANLVTTAGPAIERGADLMGILTNLGEHDVLFIDEVHRLPRPVEELLYRAMEDFAVDFVIDKGLHARTLKYALSPFTCIGTAEHERQIPASLRSNFPVVITLRPYSENDLASIAMKRAQADGFVLTAGAASLVARLARGSLQQSITLLRFLKTSTGEVTEDQAMSVLSRLGFGSGGEPPSSDPEGVPEDLIQLSGEEFERLIANLLDHMGFTTELTRASGDGGIDVVALLDRPLVGGRYVIQCKRYADGSLVGAPIVRDFYGAVAADRRVAKGVLITTSDFTSQAREFAQGVAIELINGVQLRELLAGHGPDFTSR